MFNSALISIPKPTGQNTEKHNLVIGMTGPSLLHSFSIMISSPLFPIHHLFYHNNHNQNDRLRNFGVLGVGNELLFCREETV